MPPRKRRNSESKQKDTNKVQKIDSDAEKSEQSHSSKSDDSSKKTEKKVYDIFQKRPVVSKSSESEDSADEAVDTSPRPWKFICWNVAGLRSVVKKSNFSEILAHDPDLILLEETKCTEWPEVALKAFKGYKKTLLVSQTLKGGYAGIALLSKIKPLSIIRGTGDKEFDVDGRLIIAEYPNFYFVGAYVPNSGAGLKNLEKRGRYEELFLAKMKELNELKPVIYGGDLNVAHNEIDLANPETNRNKTAGFTDQEREWFGKLLGSGFVDTYRRLHPNEKGAYTYYSYRFNARAKNIGWRLDYFLVSERVFEQVEESSIMKEVTGSDHLPILLKITL